MAAAGKGDLRVLFRGAEQSSVLKREGANTGQKTRTAEQSWSHCGLIGHDQQLES